ncbi:MAG: serine hydrolase domain-containing protein [Polyangiales bacterium]
MRLPLVLIASLCFACSSKSETPAVTPDGGAEVQLSLDDFVKQQMEAAHLPSVAIAVIKNGKVVLTRAWGTADLEKSIPATDSSIYVLGSVSKTMTGVAIMTLVEKGKLDLDADVSDYVGFPVRNPKFPDDKITLRMLMTHTSSIDESDANLVKLAQPGDPAVDLEGLLKPYLTPGGATYIEGQSYLPQKPGSKFSYSNFGAALAALAAEKVAGEPFHQHVKHAVLEPLGLKNTSFRLSELDPAKLTVQYTYVSGKGQEPNPQTSVPYYPATTLRTSVTDLARFLTMMSRGGEIDGVRILKSETVDDMVKVQVPVSDPGNDVNGQGLLWEHRPILDHHCVGHAGSYYGASTQMHMRIERDIGVITLTNGDVHLRLSVTHDEEMQAWIAIENRLYQDAQNL